MFKLRACLAATIIASVAAGCAEDSSERVSAPVAPTTSETVSLTADNPFAAPSTLEFGYPRFDLIEDLHYMPAFEAGMQAQLAEIAAIAANGDAPTVDNTLVPLETSGQLLDRVASVFYGIAGAHTNDTLREIQAEIAPRMAAHSDEILLNEQLFERVRSIYEQRESLGLDAETLRLVEETHKDFVRAGAALSHDDQERLRAINAELAELRTQFEQNVLDAGNAGAIVVDDAAMLAGLSDAQIQTAAEAAASRESDGQYAIPLLNTTQQPLMSVLENRALRERMLEASMARANDGGEFDNREIASRLARLRAERAQLLGYATHADYILADRTAGTIDAVNTRLAELTPAAVANARREAVDLQAVIDAEGGDFELAAWDWEFYAEKLRRERYAFDDNELKPYLELDRVLNDGVFFAANQIYGLTFSERTDLPVYEDTVRVFEVFDHDGSTLAFFIFDAYARPSKRGGAWARAYVSQSGLLNTRPVVANHTNITRPAAGEPTLLTFTEVNTMFHEFGHALHAMFSDVTYPSFSGTAVPRDFVEYPSQVNEMWAVWPDVLRNYARHYETDEPLPPELLERFLAAENFNQGYSTTEYLAASIIDQALHQLAPQDVPSADEIMAFETATLAAAGADLEIVPPRYRYPYFLHVFSYAYSAAYYSYVWSEVFDADTVEWFKENGGMTRDNGQWLRDRLLSKGGSVDPMAMYRDFRGRDADVRPLLERRGLL
jgi:peptidyl-dipeptidase Dcp